MNLLWNTAVCTVAALIVNALLCDLRVAAGWA